MTKILDCTLRDGGYYTNWDFNSEIIDVYLKAMNALPIDYVEVGYRNNPSDSYLGEFGYTPVPVLKYIRTVCTKKLAVMINEKNTRQEHLPNLLWPVSGLVDLVRIAVDPKNIDRALGLASSIKSMGFEVGLNCMYMSKWRSEYPDFINKLNRFDSKADFLFMVDSYGGVTPDDVKNIFNEVHSHTTCPIGFHGHNNLQLGLINTLTAQQCGCECVDATILGMGRGAGNLNMELLLTFLNAKEGLEIDFNILGEVVSAFEQLNERYHWGTTLPYMLAGANCIPQKEVMDWVTNRVYSFNTIVRALENRKNGKADNAKFPLIDIKKKYNSVLLVGGGHSVIDHVDAVKEFINSHQNIALVFATATNASHFIGMKIPKYYCLNGDEGKRLTSRVGKEHFDGECILAPYPRVMGTYVPSYAIPYTFELPSIDIAGDAKDSVTAIALEVALTITDGDIYSIGYDGYFAKELSEKESILTMENESIFKKFESRKGCKLISLTPSYYKELKIVSLYQLI